jgi:hypothetical protein
MAWWIGGFGLLLVATLVGTTAWSARHPVSSSARPSSRTPGQVFVTLVSIVLGLLMAAIGLFATMWDGACEGAACVTTPSSILLFAGVLLILSPAVLWLRDRCLAGAGVAALLACGGAVWLVAVTHGSSLEKSAMGTDGPAVVVEPESGHVGSVRLGDSPRRLAALFGHGRRAGDPGSNPDWLRLGIPGTYGYPRPCLDHRPGALSDWSFPGARATACENRTYLIVVTSRGSRTTAGARIGEPLQTAARRHRGLKCDTSTGDTTDPPVPTYRYCTGQVGKGRYLWLGQDPVSSIAISAVPLA